MENLRPGRCHAGGRHRVVAVHETLLQPTGADHAVRGSVACPATACMRLTSMVCASGSDLEGMHYMYGWIPLQVARVTWISKLSHVSINGQRVLYLDLTSAIEISLADRSLHHALTTRPHEFQNSQPISESVRRHVAIAGKRLAVRTVD